VDPNRATAVELDRPPGIGAATAREVVAFRDSAGGFRGPQELARVRGIGEATVARLRPLLDFSVAMPAALSRRGLEGTRARVAVNRADEATLETLPGVGPALARRIVEARRLRLFGQAEDLLAVPGIGPATLERIRPWITLDP